MAPLVSIIMTVYNDEQHLAPAVESVLAQTVPDLELICVDDGSTDGSAEILTACAARDARVTVLRQANAGAGVARRLGAESATGTYIYFMDSDDLLEPFAFERATELAERDQLDLVRFETRSFADTPEQEAQAARENGWWPLKAEYAPTLSGGDLFAALVANREYQPMSWLHLMRRDTLARHGVTWPAQRWSEDQAYTVHCYLAADRAGVIAEPLHRRRSRATSISRTSATAPYLQGRVRAYIDIANLTTRYYPPTPATAPGGETDALATDAPAVGALGEVAARQLRYAATALDELGREQVWELLGPVGEDADGLVVVPTLECMVDMLDHERAVVARAKRLEARFAAFNSSLVATVWRRLTRRR